MNNSGGTAIQQTQDVQSTSNYQGYPKIAQDGPVDRYIQQLPNDQADLGNFFSLFLPSPEFSLDATTTPAQNPLKLQYNDPNLQSKLLKTQGSRKRRAAVKQDISVDETELATLAPEERVKQTRLLKNRQAAQQFRKRQKTHIIELENQVETLTSDNAVLVSRMEMLTAENKLIKEQLEYMRNFVMNCLQLSFPPNTSLQDLQRFGQLAGHSVFATQKGQPDAYSKPSIPPLNSIGHHFHPSLHHPHQQQHLSSHPAHAILRQAQGM